MKKLSVSEFVFPNQLYSLLPNNVGGIFGKKYTYIYIYILCYFQIVLACILSTCYAARLENTYLPPGGAGGAGGNGLPAPFPGRPGGKISDCLYLIIRYFIQNESLILIR